MLEGHSGSPLPISIHALREEGDAKATEIEVEILNFYPRPPRGGRLGPAGEWSRVVPFLSTPSARRATYTDTITLTASEISIHALREEGDLSPFKKGDIGASISIHALREEGDPSGYRRCKPLSKFLSTPSARRATVEATVSASAKNISIHALREEGDAAAAKSSATMPDFYPRPPRGGRHGEWWDSWDSGAISIHALREEGDDAGINTERLSWIFLSTPSARRATALLVKYIVGEKYFYPRPPRGGRPAALWTLAEEAKFLSTPSARRATSIGSAQTHSSAISIHALREEGDCSWQSQLLPAWKFLSTPSARRATSLPSTTPASSKNFYPRPPRGGRPVL